MSRYKSDDFYISKAKYRELSWFCRQYDEFQRKLKECYKYPSSALSDSAKAKVSVSCVERNGEKALRYSTVIDLIETTLKEACCNDKGMYPYLLKAVTQGFTWEHLPDCPCGRRQFYELRRKFFFMLSQKR